MNEKQIETDILNFLNSVPNVFAFKVNTVGTFDPRKRVFRTNKNPHLHNGTSDIIGCAWGKCFAMEVKKPKPSKTYPSKNQKLFIEKINSALGHGCVVRSVDEAREQLKLISLEDLKGTP